MISKPKLLSIKRLLNKKEREEQGKFIIEGWKSVDEAIAAGVEIETVIYDAQSLDNSKILSRLERSAKEVIAVRTKEMESISDTVTAQGIIAVLPKLSHDGALKKILKQPAALIVALDGISDPGNLGTIIRTCDWFGVDALVIGANTVDVYNPKVVRATMGSLFHLPIIDDTGLAEFITSGRKENFSVYSAELSRSEDIRTITFSKKSIIIIGSESHGVSAEISRLSGQKILIPHFGKAESLNAAMACGIVLSYIKL